MSDKLTLAMRHAPVWIFVLVAGLLLAVAGEGPDFGHYADWAAAALSGDIFRLGGNVLSPAGVPFSLAAAGPGLMFAVGKALLLPLTLGSAALLTGWIATLVFWGSALLVLRRVADGREWLALLGAGALFVGTHAGLYSYSYATEALANALVAALWALTLTRERWRLLDSALAGALAGLLLLVRAHVVLYAIPALWLAVIGDASLFSLRGGLERLPFPPLGWPLLRSLAARVAVTSIPLAIAVAEYATVNRWMTGSLLHPPYVYGGGGFTSVDLRHPELAAVLFHPWHGLLSYHPLYGLAFVAVAIEAWHQGARRALWSVTLVAAIAHVWVQAGWYIWWLGGSTFGMRGMAPAALPLVAGVIAGVRRNLETNPRLASAWVWAIALACAWSYPLLRAGNTQFLSWGALIDAQRPALAAVVALVLAWAFWRATHHRVDAGEVERGCRVATSVLATAVVVHLVWLLALMPGQTMRIAKGAAGAALVGIVVTWLNRSLRGGSAGSGPPVWVQTRDRGLLRLVLSAAGLALFAAQAVLFGRLAVRTERTLASGVSPPRAFEYVSASPVDELRVTYAEYREVHGFASQKAAFRRFLTWQRIDASSLPAADRQIAIAVRERILRESVFGDLLVEATVRGGVAVITAPGMSEAQQSRARELALGVPGVVAVDFSAT